MIIILKNNLESVAGPVIQANGRLTFEDDLGSGGLLYFTTQGTSIRTELVSCKLRAAGIDVSQKQQPKNGEKSV